MTWNLFDVKIIFQDDGDYEADLRLNYLCKTGSLGAAPDQPRPRSKSQAVSQTKSANYLNGLESQEC